MKRILSWGLLLSLLLFPFSAKAGAENAEADSAAPTRIIHVVYDDSGSMIRTDGKLVDTWCQAKYAMEVFAALMGEKDAINIYVMSDFDSSAVAEPKLALRGASGQEGNVSQVHNMVTRAGNTPFDSVRKAYSDLVNAQADEKWLVVLTDGAFQGVDDINGFFAQKAGDIRVMFLGMGPNAAAIQENTAAGIYYAKAATSKDILSEVTQISTRIFNSNRLDTTAAGRVNFSVPMQELVVFAQGANVQIGEITSAGGKSYPASTSPVTVQYSEEAASNYPEFIVDQNLKGCLLTFRGDFPVGEYQIDVTGADTVEVYYRPDIEIAAYLYDGDGNEVTTLQNLKAGEYTISFGFVRTGTNERVEDLSLLGDVTYSAIVTRNGVEDSTLYTSGDKIFLEEGGLQIDATARYLEYNYVKTHLDYSIYTDKAATLSVLDSPEYPIDKHGIDSSVPTRIQIEIADTEMTDELWQEMELPTVALSNDEAGNGGYGEFVVEKSDTPGIYEVYPSLADGEMATDLYQNHDYTVSYQSKHGDATWAGSGSGSLHVNDTRSWLDRYLHVIIKWIIIAIIAIILAGYLPFFKKYLPKNLKKRPAVDCSPNQPGIMGMKGKGSFNKKLLSTLIPYRAERGTIKFLPIGASGAPPLQVKSAGGSAMLVLNYKSYEGKEHITFNGSSIPEGQRKPPRITSNVMIVVNTKEMTYTCIPSIK